ncbi:type 1 glutamine amidotransferase [Microvirga thermotolerans]|uniref:Type 1 glutamine amidotransferase n=1 Tax=Microvirga thermotolerans TaxID=2651334 RepID=A0A5P9JUN1_9HYPH|nr:type 1 glutamine amidotransferase [Microvirga thermotolerans]QFU15488.1 type 1 glutamine amidotransferase [Microvirga thermotolerans]
MGLRFLVVEGNTRGARQAHKDVYGLMPSESYAAVLQDIEPDAVCDLAFPADEGANLPDAAGLESYDGIVLTGSHLNIYDRTPDILRQIDLMRAIYASGTPSFGSCWGLQVAAVAADGDVRPNPSGREIGFARRLARTEAGQGHALLAGRPAVYDAPAIHLDMVTVPPPGCTVLASNGVSFVQAAEIAAGGGTFWGVQYHPEFSLEELAVILDRRTAILLDEGFCRTAEDAAAYVADLRTLHAQPDRSDLAWRHGLDAEVLDPERRTREIRNFVAHRVKPAKSARGRA